MTTFDDDISEALSAPLGDLIASVGRGVAQAQEALDHQALETFRALAQDTPGFEALRAIGYQPTWYAIPETEAELSLTLSVTGETESPPTAPISPLARRVALRVTPIDAAYTRRYEFDVQAASKLKFRIVPVPPASGTDGMQIAPDLVGKTMAEARTRAEDLGIEVVVDWGTGAEDDTRTVASQQPTGGQIVLADAAIALVVAEP